MKIGYALPAYRQHEHANIGMQRWVEGMELARDGHAVIPWWVDCSGIARARNKILKHAVSREWDYVLMQDTDIFVPDHKSAIRPMLETAEQTGAAMVGAICGLRRIHADRVEPNVLPFKPGEVYEATRVGAGLILINVNWIAAAQEQYAGPWFAETYKDERQTELKLGEDIFFCEVVTGLGGKIVVDGRVETVHAYLDTDRLHYSPDVADTGTQPGNSAEQERSNAA